MIGYHRKHVLGVVVASSLLACTPKLVPVEDAGGETLHDAGEVDAGPDLVKCAEAPQNTGPIFSDQTEAWGLGKTGLNVTGNRLSTADLDNDGFPDLLVHAISSSARTMAVDGGRQLVWQLMNRPRPSGGRMFVDATGNGLFQIRGGTDGGVDLYRAAHFAVFADIDNDGDLDAFSATSSDPTQPGKDTGDRSELLFNDGTGKFTLAPPSAPRPAANQLWPIAGASFTDADLDGKIDLFNGYWYERYGLTYNGLQAQLYKGVGDGTFTSLTAGSGLETTKDGFEEGTNHRPAYGVTSCDLDDDGLPELLVSAYGRQFNQLYKNKGNAKFADVAFDAGFSGDSITDYSDNQFFACYCKAHPTQSDCVGVKAPVIGCPNPPDQLWSDGIDGRLWRNGGNTFTTLCAELTGDSRLDLYNSEIKHWHIGQSSDSSELLVNFGELRFARPGNAKTGMVIPHPTADWNEGGIHSGAGDFDKDGRQDVLSGFTDYPDQFGLLFLAKPDGGFSEQGQAQGFHHACLSGLAIADFDRDGDLDAVVGSGTARDCFQTWKTNEVHFYENKAAGQWLELTLEGDGIKANRAAIGAKVTVKVNGLEMVREVSGGYGHMGMQNDTTLHFGLAGCDQVDSVTVRWPDAMRSTQTFTRLQAGKRYKLKQGDPPVALP